MVDLAFLGGNWFPTRSPSGFQLAASRNCNSKYMYYHFNVFFNLSSHIRLLNAVVDNNPEGTRVRGTWESCAKTPARLTVSFVCPDSRPLRVVEPRPPLFQYMRHLQFYLARRCVPTAERWSKLASKKKRRKKPRKSVTLNSTNCIFASAVEVLSECTNLGRKSVWYLVSQKSEENNFRRADVIPARELCLVLFLAFGLALSIPSTKEAAWHGRLIHCISLSGDH